MRSRPFVVILALGLAFGLTWWLLANLGGADLDAELATETSTPSLLTGTEKGAVASPDERDGAAASRRNAGTVGARIRGRVLDSRTGSPVAGVEVAALDRHPAFAGVEVRIMDLLREGFWKPRAIPTVNVLTRTVSDGQGRFELDGLKAGVVFLDARSDSYYTRLPRSVRLAGREARSGVEILVAPGGRIRGKVFDPSGKLVAGARVVLRPGANATLAQLTRGSYRWFEVKTDDDGRYDIAGVPPGSGYAISAMAPGMAISQVRELSVVAGRSTEVDLRGTVGATITGTVRKRDGTPAKGAWVGFAYMDLSRVLFSLGPDNPATANENGEFRIDNVGPGKVAVSSLLETKALAEPQMLVVHEGAAYEVELELGIGNGVKGRVVDANGSPVAGAIVSGRGMDRPQGLDLSLIAQFYKVETESAEDGSFELEGLVAKRVMVEADKDGYLPAMSFRNLDDPEQQGELVLKLERGVYITGRVTGSNKDPIQRFHVEARPSRGQRFGRRMRPGDAAGEAQRFGRQRRRMQSFSARNPFNSDKSLWQMGGDEISDPDGRFRVGPFAAGRVRVRAEAEGYVRSDSQEVEVRAGEQPEELAFELHRGATLRGRVLSQANQPVGDAQITWRRADRRRRDNGGLRELLPFKIDIQPEDFDFMRLSSTFSRRSVLSDAAGNFEITGVPAGKVRLTARHPTFAKVSLTEVEVPDQKLVEGLVLVLGEGGAIEGTVTGLDGKVVSGAMVTALSVAKGVMRSATTNPAGYYKMDGLAPGPYMVFKTRMDAVASHVVDDLLGNVRLKMTTVKVGETSRVDIADRTEGGVDVFGVVTSGGKPAKGAVVTLLGQDKNGPFGIGFRSGTSDDQGNYRIASVQPGRYTCQLTRRESSRPERASLPFRVPSGATRVRIDLQFPDGVLAGRVIDSSGVPVRDIRVSAITQDRGDRPGGLLGMISQAGGNSRSRSGDDGRFEIRRLPPGTWKLRAEARGDAKDQFAAVESQTFTLVAKQRIDNITLVLPRAAVIEGIVTDRGGQPISGAVVRVAGKGNKDGGEAGDASQAAMAALVRRFRQTARSGRDGKFKISGLLPGEYSVEAEKKGLMTASSGNVLLNPGVRSQVSLQMTKGGHLYLRVLDLAGNPFKAGQVRVLDSKGTEVGKTRSLFSVLSGLFASKKKDGASDWMDMGVLAPDTYTLEVTQKQKDGKTEVRRQTRTLHEGEEARWEVKYSELVSDGEPARR